MKFIKAGYSLLLANTNITINPSLYKTLPYDTAAAPTSTAIRKGHEWRTRSVSSLRWLINGNR